VDDRLTKVKKFEEEVRKNNREDEAFQIKRETIIEDLY
jgi:hypothetical protein